MVKKSFLFLALLIGVNAFAVTPHEQLIKLSGEWIGTPYVGGPLGEGRKGRYDQDPLFRFDEFDCVTYVETTLSYALATNLDDFEKRLNEIRYQDAEVDYVSRNHFTEVDWLPHNLANGILFDVMRDVEKNASDKFPVAVARIDKKNWYLKKTISEIKIDGISDKKKLKLLKELNVRGKKIPVEISQLPYIPFSEFRDTAGAFTDKILNGLPKVLVLSVVRPGWDLVKVAGTELNISHQGLLLEIDGQWVVRHATSDSRLKVVEDRLEDFLNKRQKTSGVKGIHVVGVSGF